jgi:hypothetical protein
MQDGRRPTLVRGACPHGLSAGQAWSTARSLMMPRTVRRHQPPFLRESLESSTEKMDTVFAELVNFFQTLKSGSLSAHLIFLALALVGLGLIVAVAYQRFAIKRLQIASEATQEEFRNIAADLRKRALEVKKQDEGLRRRDLAVEERDELKAFVKSADVELRCEPQRQVLKGSQRAMKGSVSHIITVGLKDIQTRMLQTNFKVITSAVPDKADLLRRTEEAA